MRAECQFVKAENDVNKKRKHTCRRDSGNDAKNNEMEYAAKLESSVRVMLDLCGECFGNIASSAFEWIGEKVRPVWPVS